MRKEQIVALFPLKARITKEIIESAKVFNARNCIGALTLKSVLPDELKGSASWGSRSSCSTFERFGLIVTTEEGIDMMEVKNPRNVTFILK